MADTGIGLPEGFDYRQVDTLGLQLVYGLAPQLPAEVSIRSGAGTRVVVRIPEDNEGT